MTEDRQPAWAVTALEAWDQHRELTQREQAERADAAVKRATTWWTQVGLGELPEPLAVQVVASGVRVVLEEQTGEQAGLAVLIPERGRAVMLEVHDGSKWLPAGELGTAADLGRVLADGLEAGDAPPPPPNTAELLLQVLEALVDDAVARHLEGRL